MVKCIFVEGAITRHILKISDINLDNQVGATAIFKGSVRADIIDEKQVACIEFSTQKDIATSIATKLLEASKEKYSLIGASIIHSIGEVKVGEICFTVEVKAQHRKEAFMALTEIVDDFKANVPVFGKEFLEDKSYVWKQNRL